MTDGLTQYEHMLFTECVDVWKRMLPRNRRRMQHLQGEVPVRDLGISIPPPMKRMLRRCSVMWARQAVHRIADASCVERWVCEGGLPAELAEIIDGNWLDDQYDEILPSMLAHGPAFFTVTPGGAGEPGAVVASYDAEHAAALYDYRRRRVLAGVTIVDVDPKEPDRPTAVNFFGPDGCVVELSLNGRGQWSATRHEHNAGGCLMVPMRHGPTRLKPFGESAITPAIMSLEEEANRECVRMVMQSELFTAPTRWVMGAPDDIFESGRWEAYLGSIFALPLDDEGNPPKTGQYAQGDMSPHVAYMRQLANQFAAEASIPVHSLLYTEANPASAEAIEASRNDLVEKVAKLNRLNARALRSVGLLALAVARGVPVARLGERERGLSVKFRNPARPSLAAAADAANKIAATVPEFAQTLDYWTMQGFDADEAERIAAEVQDARARQAGADLLAGILDSGNRGEAGGQGLLDG